MRRRRQLILTVLILLTAVGLTGLGLGTLLKREPDFYLAEHPGKADDTRTAAEVITRSNDTKNDIRSKADWGVAFTGDDINAFFREALGPTGQLADYLPNHVSEPRLSLDGDRLRLAARYGEGFWSTVVSVELRAWLVKPQEDAVEPNTVAVEFVGMWVGGLPIGTQSILDTITEAARDSNIVVTWFRQDGHPVGVFRFYADQARPTTQIRRLTVGDGRITVAGKSMLDSGAGGPLATAPRDPE
ncbi:MAG: hypothetical protein ACRC7O_04820 [Fimbriiglobus sp.]